MLIIYFILTLFKYNFCNDTLIEIKTRTTGFSGGMIKYR